MNRLILCRSFTQGKLIYEHIGRSPFTPMAHSVRIFSGFAGSFFLLSGNFSLVSAVSCCLIFATDYYSTTVIRRLEAGLVRQIYYDEQYDKMFIQCV